MTLNGRTPWNRTCREGEAKALVPSTSGDEELLRAAGRLVSPWECPHCAARSAHCHGCEHRRAADFAAHVNGFEQVATDGVTAACCVISTSSGAAVVSIQLGLPSRLWHPLQRWRRSPAAAVVFRELLPVGLNPEPHVTQLLQRAASPDLPEAANHYRCGAVRSAACCI